MAIRRESKEEKVKEERVSKSPDDAVGDPPAPKKEPVVEVIATSEPESTGQEESKTSRKQQKQQIANRVLEETKQNIGTAAKEASEEIPRFTKAAEVIENYIEVQRQMISSLQSSWIPYLEDTATLFWNSFLSPQRIVELYANSVAGFADVCILANRTINNYFFENMETFKNNVEHANQISNDLARACMNFAKLETKERDVIDTKSHVSEGDVTAVETRSI